MPKQSRLVLKPLEEAVENETRREGVERNKRNAKIEEHNKMVEEQEKWIVWVSIFGKAFFK